MNARDNYFESESSARGFLEIFKKEKGKEPELLHSGKNIILDNYRVNITNLAVDDDGFDDVTSENLYEHLIPHTIRLDNDGSRILEDGSELINIPDTTTVVDPTNPNFYSHLIDEKVVGVQPNIAVFKIRLLMSEGNGKTFSRATLVSLNGEMIATKCFESILKKESWELFFRWSIAY